MSVDLPPAIRGYFDSLNRNDWEGLARIWHPDARMNATGARPRHGVADVLDYFKGIFQAWPAHDDQPTRVLPSGSSYTVEVHFKGTTEDGRTFEFDAVDVFDLENGLIKRLTNWYDVVLVRRMLEGQPVRS
jgi:ketosteroid isomerase-like protein